MAADKLAGGITKAQANAWKAQYGEVKVIEVDADDNGKDVITGYFRKPDLTIMSFASAEENEVKKAKVLFSNCWLGGDQRMVNDEIALWAAAQKLVDLFKIKQARIKNL
jgi:hypothetical protein